MSARYLELLATYIEACKQRSQKPVVASGYFNPLHTGHLRYLEDAKRLAGESPLIVVVNNDYQVDLKQSYPFMKEEDRLEIVESLKVVDYAVLAVDEDRSINKTLSILRPSFFVNGGDVRSEKDCREVEVCRKYGIRMVFGVGGEKTRSSSDLLRNLV